MILKHKELDIPQGEPFKFCKLNRFTYAETLTTVLRNYADGFVLSLNNPWGTGKTTFVKMLQGHLNNEGFTTIYFNAWENDFNADPLVALMSELGSLTNLKSDETFNNLIHKASLISHSIIPGLVKALAAKYIDVDTLSEVIGNAAQGVSDVLKDEIQEYTNKKKGLGDFRKELEKYVREKSPDKPIIIFIDELDRCRPNYSVEVLEQVKHFFSVPGIVFVLSMDKEQLGNAVKGFYGSESINSDEYLKRFIDLEFMIPAPSRSVFSKYLYDYYGFDEFFASEGRKRYSEFTNDKESFNYFAAALFDSKGITLRQQEKLFSHARIVLNTFRSNNYVFPSLFLFLVYVKHHHKNFYKMLSSPIVPLQTILDNLKEVFPDVASTTESRTYMMTEAALIVFYNNGYVNGRGVQDELYKDVEGVKKLLIKPVTDRSVVSQVFINALDTYSRGSWSDIKLSYFLKKVDLLDNIIS